MWLKWKGSYLGFYIFDLKSKMFTTNFFGPIFLSSKKHAAYFSENKTEEFVVKNQELEQVHLDNYNVQ